MNDEIDLSSIQDRLLGWYRSGHRELPWRATRDPYRILVSEIMLQQTQADRVVPKYHEFLDHFPTLRSLSDAPASEVIRAWSGLGYNRRALNLQRACRDVLERFGGEMPRDPELLATLPGVGPYTAGAVACFAFEIDVAFVEIPEPRMTVREVGEAARTLLPPGEGYTWNQALMELGATICRARATECERCPLQSHCRARPTIQALLAQMPRVRGTKPERYESTSRFVRGRIVEALRIAPSGGMTALEIGRLIWPEGGETTLVELTSHLAGLERDGLVVRLAADGNGVTSTGIQEDAPAYDTGAPSTAEHYALPD
jgi:A/G-specific adenine glycosylase